MVVTWEYKKKSWSGQITAGVCTGRTTNFVRTAAGMFFFTGDDDFNNVVLCG